MIISEQTLMYKVLSKNIIKNEIVVHLPSPKRGFLPTVALEEIVNAILYKLKTGVHWGLYPFRVCLQKKYKLAVHLLSLRVLTATRIGVKPYPQKNH
ncbi:MAG: hypothetical protein LC115_10805 [Bacteroidia bacterium]|nr:hypothetical protein [Bacteroidia bacterium]